jgi:hypothetical protein
MNHCALTKAVVVFGKFFQFFLTFSQLIFGLFGTVNFLKIQYMLGDSVCRDDISPVDEV